MYLVVGANGFLGSYMIKNIIDKTEDNIIAVARSINRVTVRHRIKWYSCDISIKNDVDMLCKEINDYNDVKVIFLAAYHNPDLVEKNPKLGWNINVTSLSYFLNELKTIRCLFYPSTDSVYGNSLDGYHFKENDRLNPVNIYGKQKCAAESVVIWHGYNVVRYPFLIGSSLSPIKKHFYDKIVNHLTRGEKIELFIDSYRSSLDFNTAAGYTIDLIERYNEKTPKILNVCGDDDLSKYDIGMMISKSLGLDSNLVVPVSVEKTDGIFETIRAKSTLMDNSLYKEWMGISRIEISL